MSSTDVPWPGNNGSSTVKPASANAWAKPRIDCGEPVNPCSTSAPSGPPAAENGSAPGSTGAADSPLRGPLGPRLASLDSGIRVLRTVGIVPPVIGRGRRFRVFVDAVHRAHRQALAAAGAQLRDDDHVDPVVEDGAEVRRAVAQAGVAVDALRHLDAQRRQL